MKKTILFLASAAMLLLAGCSKEMSPNAGADGEEVTVSFTTEIPGASATKATIDNDGNGANVDQCRLQIWWGDVLLYDKTKSVSGLKATFDDIKLIKNQTYDFLFWADNNAGAYYDTDDLHSVTLAKDYVGNDDARDAFAQSIVGRTVTAAFTDTVHLYRPFAQVNVITTDIDDLWNQLPESSRTLDNLKKVVPDKVAVTYTAPNQYNVATKEVSGSREFTWSKAIYGAFTTTLDKQTLSMDYIFAPATESNVIDIKYVAKNSTTGAFDIDYTFTNIPVQRNYRTNIIGDLLTNAAKFTVVVEPAWTEPEKNVYYKELNSTSEVRNAIAAKSEDTSLNGQAAQITVKSTVAGENPDIIIPDNTSSTVTPEIILDFTTMDSDAKITIRDEKHAESGAKEYEGAVTVVVPDSFKASQISILTDKSHVVIRGEYGNVIASCSPSTIVVDEDAKITGVLTVKKGNVAVYGQVKSIARDADNEDAVTYVDIFDGTCGNGVWTNETGEVSAVLVARHPVATIDREVYFDMQEAVDAAPAGTQKTIDLLGNFEGSGVKVVAGKNLVFNLNGYTYTVINPTVGSTGTETNAFQLLEGSTVKFENGALESSVAKIFLQNYCDLTLDNVVLNSKKNSQMLYALSDNNGTVTIKDSKIYGSAGRVAFDVCRYSKYTGPAVTVTGSSMIEGTIEISCSGAKENATHKLTLENGDFSKAALSFADGHVCPNFSILKADAVEFTAPIGYKWVDSSTAGYQTLEASVE